VRWGNDCRNSSWRKVASDGADVMSACRLFQTRRLATGKPRVPIFDRLNGGTTRRLVPAERRDQADRQHEQQVRYTPVWSHAEPWTLARRSCRWRAPGRAASASWPAHLLHDRSVEVYKSTVRKKKISGRSIVPQLTSNSSTSRKFINIYRRPNTNNCCICIAIL